MPHAGETTAGHGASKVIFGKYEVGRLLGRGSTSKVHLGRHIATEQSVAIKCISKNRILRGGLTSNIKREIAIMRRLRHDHIVRLFEVLASRDKIYFVMEFVKGGELFSRLDAKGRHDEDIARRYFQQLISAIGFCHSRGVFHRDLKPENILIDEHGDLKVTDFGLSAVSDQIRQDGLFHTLCGTPAYVAPEILCRKGYDGAKVDIWSCGVILFVLVAGYLPFNDPNLMVMYKRIYRGDYRCPKWMSPELKHLISRLLDTNPSTRITVDGILNDPWFRKSSSEEELASFSKFHVEEQQKELAVMEDRELNAFDLISFSSGFDLSALFEPAPVRDRFVCSHAPEGILGKLEKSWGEEGLLARRTGEHGMGLTVESRTGTLAAKVEIYRLNRDMVVVETELYGRFWEDKLRPFLNRLALEPVPAVSR